MSGLPVWLCDVDGVVNARQPQWDEQPRDAGCFGKTGGWRIRWAPRLAARMQRIADLGLAEIRWATSWAEYTHELGRTLRVAQFPAAFSARPPHKTWGDMKAEAAVAVVESGRPLVWTDDREVNAGRALFPVLAAAERRGQALLIEPVSEHGLTPEDLRRIERFLGWQHDKGRR